MMLQFIRDRAQGWIAWVIVGFLIVPFALWGINEYFTGGGKANVATVNGEEISLGEYQFAYQNQRNRIRSMLGKQATAEMLDNFVKPNDVLNGLIENELLIQEAMDQGYSVSIEQIAAQIRSIQAFQQDGKFVTSIYEQLLRSQGDTPASFEARMNRAVIIDQINSGLMNTSITTKKVTEQYIKLKRQKRDLGYLLIAASDYEEGVNVTDEQINDYFQSHQDQYFKPEQVSVDYVELDAEVLGQKIKATEEQLQSLYEKEKDRYSVGEERRASHILVEIGKDGAEEEGVNKAKEKSAALLKRIHAGESFDLIAKKHSDDLGSATEGGDLGFFGQGVMDTAFEEKVFAMKIDEVSGPIKTSFGYHLIKLLEIRPGSEKSFAEVKNEIEKLFRQNKAEDQFSDQAEMLANMAYESPDSLQPLADSLNLSIKTSGLFTRTGGKGVLANGKAIKAAFSEEVIRKGYNSEPVEVGANKLVVLRLKKHEPKVLRLVEDVTENIIRRIKRDKASEQAKNIGQQIVNKIQNGETLDSVAKEVKSSWIEKGLIDRQENKVPREIIQKLFTLKKPVNKSTVTGIKLNTGDYAVIKFSKVSDGETKSTDDPKNEQVMRELQNMYGDLTIENFITMLKNTSKVTKSLNNI